MRLERLLYLRNKNEWTQKYVARRLHISPRTYSHYEGGTREMPLDILVECAKIFGTSTDFILFLTDDERPARSPEPKKTISIRY